MSSTGRAKGAAATTPVVQRPLLGDELGRDPGRWWASSDRKDWCTPDEELELVRRLGAIGMDPCSNPGSRVAARLECMLERGENGLARPWRGHGLVFANPPYGVGEVERFTAKAVREFAARPLAGDQCLLLLPANTETQWYQRDCLQGDATCLRKGRIQFRLPDGAESENGSTVANLWVYFGERVDLFLDVFGPQGDARLTLAGARRIVASGHTLPRFFGLA